MDNDFESENKGLGKGPFYGAAAFIFVVLALFASATLKEHGTLGHWDIASCMLGSGLIAILLFLPHFLDGIIERLEDSSSRADAELANKAFLELKEVRSELDALAVKIDKVPTLVDKIVSELMIDGSEQSTNNIPEGLKDFISQIDSKLARIEETNISPDLLPDPELKEIKESLLNLTEQVDLLQKKFESSDKIKVSESLVKEKQSSKETTSLEENTPESNAEIQMIKEPNQEKIVEELIEKEVDEPIIQDKPSTEDTLEREEEPFNPLGNPDEEKPELQDMVIVGSDSNKTEKDDSLNQPEDSNKLIEKDQSKNIQEKQTNMSEELALGLPDPEETLRKVDALLAGEEISKKEEKTTSIEETKDKNGTTTVVANVMIGIGNKPYLRGEGPGLNWDEGVSMNFLEIGKWAWSPPKKNASLTVQVYRNDKDPDKSGKVEVKPGQKLEITPEFS